MVRSAIKYRMSVHVIICKLATDQTCIRNVPYLNLGRVVSYLNKVFRGLALSLQVNSDILSRLGYRSILLYNFFFYWRYNPLWVCILQPSSGL
jgi:hypothetical protein